MKFTYDGVFDISLGRSREETRWRNKEISWSALAKKVAVTHRTAETYKEYMVMKPDRQDIIKDIGGFVGGMIQGGRRKKGKIVNRQLLTLDIDFAPNADDFWDAVSMQVGAALVYSTHKHAVEKPRLRLLMPATRPMSADEYEAVSRKVASWFNIEYFDPTTFQPTRLMYWPSTSKDGVFFTKTQDGKWVDVDAVLAEYEDWQDSTEWPMSSLAKKKVRSDIDKQSDPLIKPGLIGAFCRTYPISEAIEKWLPEIYIKTDVEDRYTYKDGTTANGLVVYEDKFAYSHHSTDPISERLCNAWDLVRIHKFGHMDADAKEDLAITHMPSYKAMVDLAMQDKTIRRTIGEENLAEAREIFQADADEPAEETLKIKKTPENEDWLEEMEVDRAGLYFATINNIVLVMENDPSLKGCFRLNEFEHREEAARDLPWRKIGKRDAYISDADISNLRHYMETIYGVSSAQKLDDALAIVMRRHKYHPIRDYLNKLEWDGKQRAETLWIDYLGAYDSTYTRTVCRKALLACVYRVIDPGCKFDEMLTAIGGQGIGKSTILRKLGGKWFSDSFTSVQGTQAYEQLQGAWIVEMGELTATRKAETEQVKHFVAKQEDRFRVAYGKRVENFPRQCVFFPTTNNRNFLKDTENRRWWPIEVDQMLAVYDVFEDLSKEIVGQVWAEVMTWWMMGERIYLNKQEKEQAKTAAQRHMEVDDRNGLLNDYLDMLLPVNWPSMSVYDRRAWIEAQAEGMNEPGTVEREVVCAAEVWCEMLNGTLKDMNTWSTKEVHNMLMQAKGWERGNQKRFPLYGRQWAYMKIKN
jgi:putative DNA primase/helicase